MLNTEISIFKDTKDAGNPYNKPVSYFLNRIKNGSAATEKIIQYRTQNNEEIKKSLPACTFAGVFSYRNSKSLVKFSQFACLDFDKFEGFEKANEIKDNLLKENFIKLKEVIYKSLD